MTAVAERAFRGELILFRRLAALDALLDHAREIAFAAFADPVGDEGRLDSDSWREKAMAARRDFMRSKAVPGLLCNLFAELGFDPETTYRDRAILRFQPGRAACRTRRLRDLPPHRDSWGSNLMTQLNWWAPVFSVEPGAPNVDGRARHTGYDWFHRLSDGVCLASAR